MTFFTERRVEFRDTDAAGIVHFSAFFPMMEAAEHELLRSLGMSVLPKGDAGLSPGDLASGRRRVATMPRRPTSRICLRISVRVAKIGRTSVQYAFRFTREDAADRRGAI